MIIKSVSLLVKLRVTHTSVRMANFSVDPATCVLHSNPSVLEPVRNAVIMDGNSSDGSVV